MESPKRVIIAGGTGFLGRNLAQHFAQRGYAVVVMSRKSAMMHGDIRHVTWDARTPGDWTHHLNGAHALINLAGRTVDCIKTPEHCDEILRSRVESTRVLGIACRQVESPPPVWVQMSTAHRYGDPPDIVIDEDAAFGFGLAPLVGAAWEEAFAEAAPQHVRKVILRTSFVLGRSGGALPRLSTLARFGLGGTVGHGRQGMSWIHEADMNRMFEWAVEDDHVTGAYLATAPNPVSNADFMRALRRAMRMPIGLPAAGWMVRLGAPLVLRTDPELALYGRYCVSKRLADEGFEFTFRDIESAFADLFG